MNNDFSAFPDASFPVYRLSRDRGHKWGDLRSRDRHHRSGHESACQGLYAVYWPPLLTSNQPVAGPGADQHALAFIVRPDCSHQVTYHGRPLYLFYKDAYIGPPVGVGAQGIYGAGAHTPWGVSTRSRRCRRTPLPPSTAKAPVDSIDRGLLVHLRGRDTNAREKPIVLARSMARIVRLGSQVNDHARCRDGRPSMVPSVSSSRQHLCRVS